MERIRNLYNTSQRRRPPHEHTVVNIHAQPPPPVPEPAPVPLRPAAMTRQYLTWTLLVAILFAQLAILLR